MASPTPNLQTFETRIRRFATERLGILNGALFCRLLRTALVTTTVALVLLAGWLPSAFLNLGVALVVVVVWIVLLVRFARNRQRFQSILDEAFFMEALNGVNSRIVSAVSFLQENMKTPLTEIVIQRAETDLAMPFEDKLDRQDYSRFRKQAIIFGVVLLIVGAIPTVGVLKAAATLRSSWFLAMDRLFPVHYELIPGAGTHVHKLGDTIDLGIHFAKPGYTSVTLVLQPVLPDDGAAARAVGDADGADAPTATAPGKAAKAGAGTGDATTTRRIPLTVGADGRAVYPFSERVESEWTAWIEFGERRTEAMTVVFTTMPALVNMQTELVYPTYTRQLPRTLEGVQPRILGLEGTRITLGFTFSKELESAQLAWDDGSTLPLDTVGRYASISMVHNRTRTATLSVRDRHGFDLEQPVVIDFTLQADEPPQVVLPRHLKEDMPLLAEQATSFGFAVRAQDDYGVAKCVLQWQKVSVDNPSSIRDRGEVERLISPPRKKVNVSFDEVFTSLQLVPGDKIVFYVEAFDNRAPQAQRSASPRRSFFVYQQDLKNLNISDLGFGTADLTKMRLAKTKRASTVKQPEGQRTGEKVKNDTEVTIDTSTRAPTVRGEYRQATDDYFRVLSDVTAQDASATSKPGTPAPAPAPVEPDAAP